jgi:hypothetical protein
MSLSIWIRPLTLEEEKYFRKSDLGRQSITLGRLSIMGSADHTDITNLNIEVKLYKVNLGEGQYIYDWPSRPKATGGRKVSVLWGADSPYCYLPAEAKNLNIPVFYTPHYPQYLFPLYFQSVYADAFIESFSYADRALSTWHNERTFLARWFGGMQQEQNSKLARSISEKVRNILVKAKRAQ